MSALAGLVDKGLVAPDWAEALAPVDDRIGAMGQFLRDELAAGRPYLPAGDAILRAFERPLADVRVLVVGQDPYPTPGHPIGLSFAVARDVRPLPGSLRNIYTEIRSDLGLHPPDHGDLTAWTEQGVMLLNRVLTVRPGEPASHRGRGWEEVTSCAIDALVARGGPCVATSGAGTRRRSRGSSGRSRGSSRPTRRRCRPAAASSGRARSAGSTGCSRSRVAHPLRGAAAGNKVQSSTIEVDMNDRMPALYLGHGAPPLLDDPVWSGQLAAWAAGLPRPKAILIVSAHWESAPVMLSASHAPLVYDFGGFAPRYYQMTYETPDASALAQRVAAMMPATEPVHQHASRGLDHGAWVPLRIMYPEADIPVLQMSLPTQDPARLLALGERLRPLRDEGVLVIGSGEPKRHLAAVRQEHVRGIEL